MNNFVDPIQTSPVTNYGTMTLENKQSASRYTLVNLFVYFKLKPYTTLQF